MADNLQGRTFTKIALVIAIIAPCMAIIPCAGLFADILVIPAIIMAVIGLILTASDNKPVGFSVGVLIATVVALPVTIGIGLLSTMAWMVLFGAAASAHH